MRTLLQLFVGVVGAVSLFLLAKGVYQGEGEFIALGIVLLMTSALGQLALFIPANSPAADLTAQSKSV